MRLSIFALASMFFCACSEDIDIPPPKGAFRVLEVTPDAYLLPADSSWTFHLSRPMAPSLTQPLAVVLVKRDAVDDALVKNIVEGKLAKARQDAPIEINVTQGVKPDSIIVKPVANLEPGSAYSLFFCYKTSDQRAKRQMARYDFRVQSDGPKLVQHDVWLGDDQTVAPNRKQFHFRFSEPMALMDAHSVIIASDSGQVPVPAIEWLEQSSDRKAATIVFANPPQGCERLAPNTAYSVTFPAIQAKVSFSTRAQCDDDIVRWEKPPEVIAADTSTEVHLVANKPVAAQLWFGKFDGPLDCLGVSCPVVVDDYRASQTLSADRLEVGVKYRFLLAVEDVVGHRLQKRGVWTTSALPKITISEVIPGQYIKLVNEGTEREDVSGYFLQTCPIVEDHQSLFILPGSYIVLASPHFRADQYPDVDDSHIHQLKTAQFCGTLASRHPQVIVLRDGLGRKIASYRG